MNHHEAHHRVQQIQEYLNRIRHEIDALNGATYTDADDALAWRDTIVSNTRASITAAIQLNGLIEL